MSPHPNYHSYLLRIWRDGAGHPWRASLHCTASGEKIAFADLRTLFAFLVEQLTTDVNGEPEITITQLEKGEIYENSSV